MRELDERQRKTGKKLIVVIIPFGIPASGKWQTITTLKIVAEKLGWTLDYESRDDVLWN